MSTDGMMAIGGMRWTADGGARQDEADLWCSYAAVRTLTWLGDKPADPDAVAAFLASRRNPDGGFAWQRGLPSDVWATYYCAQALGDLGVPVPQRDRLAAWVASTRTADGGFAMMPGQPADIWATYYATRLYAEVLAAPVPDVDRLGGWLAATQTGTGGLAWQPGSDQADTRAGYYGALAWRAAAADRPVPVRRAALVAWLRDRQAADGGFGFAPGAASCAWAAFRATRALRALGAAPRDPDALHRWLDARHRPDGGYERWPGYGVSDVWACFSVVGALDALGRPLAGAAGHGVADAVRGCQLPGSGFTYRSPAAASDSLATAAALVLSARPELADWLRRAQLPYEDGVMYMPGRGAEMRCTLWAASALSTVDASLDAGRVRRWLVALQNVDGGYGYWHGRGSDLVSTVSAVELAAVSGLPVASTMDSGRLLRFLRGYRAGDDGYRPAAASAPTVAATAQAARALAVLGETGEAVALAAATDRWASPLGGYAATPRAVPDLLSTYQAVLTRQALGLGLDTGALRRFLAKVRTAGGYAWSPLSRRAAGPLAACLGAQLDRVASADPAPPLLRLNL
ncbi:prenyltransferase/squalene oxidase repeat-containing protein [Planosporangium sp. 12N6]|uniref:prenyltransferase/squalene oxidase repeat-containing protein n=1 Tax=Planosporangium spinosum TaxID=3402278 RepID=UPI003CF9D088